ncbi:aminoglycoside 6-adenylyltransferase [Bacillus salacetis]|uniref:aminoglycoside 6-adenylyltransferase n=1 Tax=Bacillus salacetis TaxID=2315464 RepID=UPI003B9F6D61
MPYAKYMFECVIRQELDEMVSWWIGTRTDFQVSSGKLGKYFEKFLSERYWKMYVKTYSDGDYGNMWDAVFTAGNLFRILGKDVADSLFFTYPEDDDRNMTEYLQRVRTLPADAEGIF